jgi:hypothetical protein
VITQQLKQIYGTAVDSSNALCAAVACTQIAEEGMEN